MEPLEKLARWLDLEQLANALYKQPAYKAESIYTHLPSDLRDSLAKFIATKPLSPHLIKHLKGLCSSQSFAYLSKWVSHPPPQISIAALDAIERLVFADSSVGPKAIQLFDALYSDENANKWARLLGTIGSNAALDRLQSLSTIAACDELARYGMKASNSSEDRAILTFALNAHENGQPLTEHNVIRLGKARKFALLWQLLNNGQLPQITHSALKASLQEAQSKSQRRFARLISAKLETSADSGTASQ